jgi:colicin import membrane protein
MFEFAREHIRGLLVAGALHAVLLTVLVAGMERRPALPETTARAPVQAVAVSESALRAAEQQQVAMREAELRRQREEEARRLAEAERQRQAEIQRQREREEAERRARVEAEQRAQAERQAREQRAAEERRRAEEAARAEEARRAEAARQAEEARRAEQARREEEARQRAEAEARRRAEEAARAEARAAAERQAQLAAQIESEQRRLRLQDTAEYRAWLGAITDQVTRQWNRPPSARPGLECEVRVGLIPGMQVVNAEILRCNGDDAVRRSIIAAVERASPLPRPSDPALFERSIVFVFKPQD